MTPLDELYFEWLYAKVRIDGGLPYQNHFQLLRQLHNTEFVWLIVGDDNRVEDGLDLREEFILTHGGSDGDAYFQSGLCSVFEMLVAFAIRAAYQSTLPEHIWFCKFLMNLGLYGVYTDDRYDSTEVEEIIDQLIWRLYSPFGEGSLFPLPKEAFRPGEDMRTKELWLQLGLYVEYNDLI